MHHYSEKTVDVKHLWELNSRSFVIEKRYPKLSILLAKQTGAQFYILLRSIRIKIMPLVKINSIWGHLQDADENSRC